MEAEISYSLLPNVWAPLDQVVFLQFPRNMTVWFDDIAHVECYVGWPNGLGLLSNGSKKNTDGTISQLRHADM